MTPKQPVNKTWRRLVGHLLVLAIIAIALFDAWQSFCAIPTEDSLSRDVGRSIGLLYYAEADVLDTVRSEMSKELAWLGSVVVVHANFTSRCQIDSCHVIDANLHTRIDFLPLCAWKNRGSGLLATVYFKDYVRPYISLSPVLAVAAESKGIQLSSSNVSYVKELALRSIEDDVWDLHPELYLQIVGPRHGWSFYIKNERVSADYYVREHLDDSDIQRIKEQKQ